MLCRSSIQSFVLRIKIINHTLYLQSAYFASFESFTWMVIIWCLCNLAFYYNSMPQAIVSITFRLILTKIHIPVQKVTIDLDPIGVKSQDFVIDTSLNFYFYLEQLTWTKSNFLTEIYNGKFFYSHALFLHTSNFSSEFSLS